MAVNPFTAISSGAAADRAAQGGRQQVVSADGRNSGFVGGGSGSTMQEAQPKSNQPQLSGAAQAVQSGAQATQQAGTGPNAGQSYAANVNAGTAPPLSGAFANVQAGTQAEFPGTQNQRQADIARIDTEGPRPPRSGNNGFNTRYGEEAYRQHGGAFTDSSRRDTYYDNIASQLTDPTLSQGAAARAAGFANGTTTGRFRQANAGFFQPGQSQTDAYMQNNAQAFAPGQGEAARHWQGVQGQFQQGSPAAQDMSSFYDNAYRKASERIQSGQAAAGLLNSSQTADAMNEANVNLAAQQAMDEAKYGLQRSADQRNWLTSGANVAQGVDASGARRAEMGLRGAGMGQDYDLGVMRTAGDLAGREQDQLLGARTLDVNASQGADAAAANRWQTGAGIVRDFDELGQRGAERAITAGQREDVHSRNLARDYVEDTRWPTQQMLEAYYNSTGAANEEWAKFIEGSANAMTGGQTTLAQGARDNWNAEQAGQANTLAIAGAIGKLLGG
jgi:hypothetical protein